MENAINQNTTPTLTATPFWYGIGAFFVTPVTAIFCILMGALMILAWPFIPFLCYMQKKEEIRKANTAGVRHEKIMSNPQDPEVAEPPKQRRSLATNLSTFFGR